MRQKIVLLLLGAILIVAAAIFVQIRTTPSPSVEDETLWQMALESAKLGDAERAIQIAMQIRNRDTYEIAMQSVADTLIERGDYYNALRVIRSLPDPYLRIIYFANIMQSIKLPEPELSSLVNEAERNARQVKIERQRKFAWAAVCRMWMQLNEIERAWRVTRNLPETQMRHGLWGELAVLFAQRGDVDKALRIAAQLPDRWEQEAGQPIDPLGLSTPIRQQELLTNRQAVLKAIAETLAQQGKVDEATKIAQTLENEAVRSQILDALADARKQVGMPPIVAKAAEETLKFTRQLEQQLGTHGLFHPLTKPLEEQVMLSKSLNEARKLPTPEAKVSRLVQIAMHFPYSPLNRKTVAAILAEASHYAREIKSPQEKVKALEQIAVCWERFGEWEKARSLENEAIRMSQRIFEVFGLKRDIVMRATKSGDLTELKEVIRKVPDPTLADMLLEQTVIKLAQNGQVKEALALIKEMAGKEYQRQNLIKRITWELVEMGKFDEALSLARRLVRNFDKASLYHRIAEVLRQKGEKEFAVALLNEVLKLVPSLSENTREFILSQISVSFARLGEREKALEILNNSGVKGDEQVYLDFASAFAEGGDFETALKFARQLPPKSQGIALNFIAAIAEHRGNKELAQKLRLEIRSIQQFTPTQRKEGMTTRVKP